jgi:hypothetical protein
MVCNVDYIIVRKKSNETAVLMNNKRIIFFNSFISNQNYSDSIS